MESSEKLDTESGLTSQILLTHREKEDSPPASAVSTPKRISHKLQPKALGESGHNMPVPVRSLSSPVHRIPPKTLPKPGQNPVPVCSSSMPTTPPNLVSFSKPVLQQKLLFEPEQKTMQSDSFSKPVPPPKSSTQSTSVQHYAEAMHNVAKTTEKTVNYLRLSKEIVARNVDTKLRLEHSPTEKLKEVLRKEVQQELTSETMQEDSRVFDFSKEKIQDLDSKFCNMAMTGLLNFDSAFFNKYATLDYYLNKGASGNVYGPIPWHGLQLALKQATFAEGKVTDEFKKHLDVKKDIWTSLEHEHLMRILSVDLNQLPKAMFIVMEFAAGGSLYRTLRSLGSRNKLSIDVVTDWAKQIADGMLYLHQKNIVHRDLKSSNILLMEPFNTCNSDMTMTLKIADFDEIKEHDHTTMLSSFVGTCAYMAPEVLKNQWFSKASDVWSFGVLLWEMLSGDIPHKGLEPATFMSKSIKGELENLPLEQSVTEDYKLLLNTEGKDVTEILKPRENIMQRSFLEVSDEAAAENEAAENEAAAENKGTITDEQLQYGQEQFETGRVARSKYGRRYLMAICGLAVMGQEVFISRLKRPNIEVYDSTIFTFKRRMEVKGMKDTEDIVSSSLNSCLYAVNWPMQSQFPAILRIDPTNGNVIKTWNIDGSGGRLSIANDTNVILSMNNEAMLYEYTADGELIRKIDLDSVRTGICRSWHAVKLNNGQFVVCHGGEGDPLSRVCLLSIRANTSALGRTDEVELLKAFGADPGESINRLKWPIYLSVDKEGSILVSDKKTVLLSSNLDEPQIIVSKEHGLRSSWRTCFDESTGQWFVADYHRVMVCRLKNEEVERKLHNLISR